MNGEFIPNHPGPICIDRSNVGVSDISRLSSLLAISGSIQKGLAMPMTSQALAYKASFIPLEVLKPPVTIRGPLKANLISLA